MATKEKDIPKLLPTDVQLLSLAAEGLEYEEIAVRLQWASAQSVKNRARKIAQHLGADNIRHAVAIALRRKIIE